MPEQSPGPVILLTRPPDPEGRFRHALEARFAAPVLDSPLMRPVFLTPAPRAGAFAGHVLSSETGVLAARRLGLAAPVAHCVGERTRAMATASGYGPGVTGRDADDLVAALLARRAAGPLLHLHGQDTRGDIAARLTAGGLPTAALAVYEMQPAPLPPEARALLDGTAPVAIPVFSPRSAALLVAAIGHARAPLWLAALSPAVAQALAPLPAVLCETAPTPDAAGMLTALARMPLVQRGA